MVHIDNPKIVSLYVGSASTSKTINGKIFAPWLFFFCIFDFCLLVLSFFRTCLVLGWELLLDFVNIVPCIGCLCVRFVSSVCCILDHKFPDPSSTFSTNRNLLNKSVLVVFIIFDLSLQMAGFQRVCLSASILMTAHSVLPPLNP